MLSKRKIIEYLESVDSDAVSVEKLVHYCKATDGEYYKHWNNNIKDILSGLDVGQSVEFGVARYGSVRACCSRYGKEWQSSFACRRQGNKIKVIRER